MSCVSKNSSPLYRLRLDGNNVEFLGSKKDKKSRKIQREEISTEDEKENLSNWDDLENGNPVNTLTATRPPMLAGSYYYPGSTHRKRDGEGKPLTEPAQALTAIRPPSMFENMEVRYINIDEAKILQSFPPDFKISLYKYIGNSVPPLMAKAVGEHVANILRGKS